MKAIELARLYVMREQIDVLIEGAEAEQCEHPEDARKYADGTMGSAPRFTCGQCGKHDITPEGA